MSYTVAMREEGHVESPFQYYGVDGKIRPSMERCKPLTLAQAELARDLLIKGAKKVGRPLECKVVEIQA